MKIGSIVETIECFEELRKTWKIPYPKKGDVLTVKSITKHPNNECKAKGIVMLQFEELNNPFGICDKQVNGKHNFVEMQLSDDIEEMLKAPLEHEISTCG